jgi:hypothetical protein
MGEELKKGRKTIENGTTKLVEYISEKDAEART